MRIRQMGFSSRLKAHKKILTLETLKFIVEYLKDNDARQAALRSGVPENYASRQGQWLKKHPIVLSALESEVDDQDMKKLAKAIAEIERQMEICKEILNLHEDPFLELNN
jgi:phage terminase small subunit